MSGHSKWANIKHQKERADAQKGQLYTRLSREIIVAAKQGGPNPETNFRLRLAIQRARQANMPVDNIERAIKRAVGEGETSNYEELTYEGYGPGGVAVMVDVLTDNRNRTAAEIRHLFSKYGGSLGESGCVAWMFERKGILFLAKESATIDEDSLTLAALEAGAEDLSVDEEGYTITTDPAAFEQVKEKLEEQGFSFDEAELTMVPTSTVPVSGQEAEKVLRLVDALEDQDDVQHVYANFEVSDTTMEALRS
ncbi:MAG: YebC/PmpR family DNA-binding transcriptional regulator [Firmicutes bacterium]|nr:YebC/PmpR family DNA-binding transcriptional regulator [Bacillota bacterium]